MHPFYRPEDSGCFPRFDLDIIFTDEALATMQWAIIAGYPTLRDLLVFGFGTVSDTHASFGRQGTGRGWLDIDCAAMGSEDKAVHWKETNEGPYSAVIVPSLSLEEIMSLAMVGVDLNKGCGTGPWC